MPGSAADLLQMCRSWQGPLQPATGPGDPPPPLPAPVWLRCGLPAQPRAPAAPPALVPAAPARASDQVEQPVCGDTCTMGYVLSRTAHRPAQLLGLLLLLVLRVPLPLCVCLHPPQEPLCQELHGVCWLRCHSCCHPLRKQPSHCLVEVGSAGGTHLALCLLLSSSSAVSFLCWAKNSCKHVYIQPVEGSIHQFAT